MGVKLLNGIKSIYVNGLACVRVKGDKIKFFRKGCVVSLTFQFLHNEVIKEVKMERVQSELNFL